MAISATDFHWTRTLSQNSWREDPVGARPAALSSAGASVLERACVDDGDREPRRGARIGLLFRKACNGSYEKWQKWAPFRSSARCFISRQVRAFLAARCLAVTQ